MSTAFKRWTSSVPLLTASAAARRQGRQLVPQSIYDFTEPRYPASLVCRSHPNPTFNGVHIWNPRGIGPKDLIGQWELRPGIDTDTDIKFVRQALRYLKPGQLRKMEFLVPSGASVQTWTTLGGKMKILDGEGFEIGHNQHFEGTGFPVLQPFARALSAGARATVAMLTGDLSWRYLNLRAVKPADMPAMSGPTTGFTHQGAAPPGGWAQIYKPGRTP